MQHDGKKFEKARIKLRLKIIIFKFTPKNAMISYAILSVLFDSSRNIQTLFSERYPSKISIHLNVYLLIVLQNRKKSCSWNFTLFLFHPLLITSRPKDELNAATSRVATRGRAEAKSCHPPLLFFFLTTFFFHVNFK